MICPNCRFPDLDNDTIFCSNCGIDVQTFSKAVSYNSSKIDKLSHLEQENDLVLSKETIKLYQKLTSNVNNLGDIPQKLQNGKIQYRLMREKLAHDTNELEQLEKNLQKEKKDVDKLNSISVQSILAKVKGDKEQRLEKEEKEYLEALNKKEAFEKDIGSQKDAINQQNKYIVELETASKKLEADKASLIKIIHQTTLGVADPVEDKIEMELENLVNKYSPLKAWVDKSQVIYNYLNMAYSSLTQALNLIGSASRYADWDTFLGGGLLVDSIKHSKMSQARDLVTQAKHYIELARNIDPSISNVDAYVDDISLFWDGFFDNIFTDWSSRNKIHNSLNSVQNAVGRLNETKNKLSNDINQVEREIDNLNNRMDSVRASLLKERKRMIEDAIKRQSS